MRCVRKRNWVSRPRSASVAREENVVRTLRLLLLSVFLLISGCQSLTNLVRSFGLFGADESPPTPFSESAAAWDGTWAEQKD